MKSFFCTLMLTTVLATSLIVPIHAANAQATGPVSSIDANIPINLHKNNSTKGPQISTFELANGMQVVVIPDRRAPVVTHMIWYKVGSAEDPRGKSGIAHFLEHLMFKGTKTVPAGEFSAKIAEIGGQENAFTSSDYTSYYQKVSPKALKMAMTYEADRMENLILNDEVVKPERDIVLEERRSRIANNPGAILSETIESTLFLHHPYGTPVIGYENEIRGLTGKDAIEFYDKYYTPNNAILVVSGDIDAKIVRTYALDTYGKVLRRAEPGHRQRTKEPEPVTARTVSYSDERVSSASMNRIYLVPSYNSGEPGEAEALDILGTILGGTSISRLHRLLVIDREIASRISASMRGAALDMTRLSIHASPRGETTIAQLEAEIDKALMEIVDNGITSEELEHARDAMIKSAIYSWDSQTTMARIVGAALTMGGNLSDVLDWPQRLKNVTVEDVNKVAKKYLVKSRSVTGYLLPKPAAGEPEKS